MSRIINKLVAASGGWEKFLYQTLKGICIIPIAEDDTAGDIIEDAREILEAYEEMGGQPNMVVPTPVVRNRATVAPEEVEPVTSENSEADVSITEPVEFSYYEPAPRFEPASKTSKGKVAVDPDAGASQGGLPIPADSRIVNRRNIVVETTSGHELGIGSEDGQIRGSGVTGHVTVSGMFRLVFKDVSLGVALMRYEVRSFLTKMTKKEFEEGVALRNNLTVKRLREALRELDKVIVPYDSATESCFGWKIEDQSEIDEAASIQKQKMDARQYEAKHTLRTK